MILLKILLIGLLSLGGLYLLGLFPHLAMGVFMLGVLITVYVFSDK